MLLYFISYNVLRAYLLSESFATKCLFDAKLKKYKILIEFILICTTSVGNFVNSLFKISTTVSVEKIFFSLNDNYLLQNSLKFY